MLLRTRGLRVQKFSTRPVPVAKNFTRTRPVTKNPPRPAGMPVPAADCRTNASCQSTIRYDTVYLTCRKKLTDSQLRLGRFAAKYLALIEYVLDSNC